MTKMLENTWNRIFTFLLRAVKFKNTVCDMNTGQKLCSVKKIYDFFVGFTRFESLPRTTFGTALV